MHPSSVTSIHPSIHRKGCRSYAIMEGALHRQVHAFACRHRPLCQWHAAELMQSGWAQYFSVAATQLKCSSCAACHGCGMMCCAVGRCIDLVSAGGQVLPHLHRSALQHWRHPQGAAALCRMHVECSQRVHGCEMRLRSSVWKQVHQWSINYLDLAPQRGAMHGSIVSTVQYIRCLAVPGVALTWEHGAQPPSACNACHSI
jgi:hypothetical protein